MDWVAVGLTLKLAALTTLILGGRRAPARVLAGDHDARLAA